MKQSIKQRIIVFFLVIAFVFSQTGLAYARGSSGSRSFGRSSYSSGSKSFSSYKSSSGSWSGSSSSSKSYSGYGSSSSGKSSSGYSSSKSSGGWSSSSSGSTGSSSSRGVPGSYSTSGTSSFNTSGSKNSTAKNSYMQSTYNKQSSASNYNTYKQTLNTEQQRAYDSAMSKNYSVGSRMNYNDALNTRNQRISTYDTNPVRINVNNYYFGGPLSYGSGFAGIWDLWFLMRASDLFWYHHWDDIYPYRSYFSASDFAAKQAAVNAMQAQGIAKSANYLDPNVAPDLQFSKAYVDSHPNSVYNTRKASHPFRTLFFMLAIVAILLFVIRKFLKKPVEPRYSSIY